ncbi:MAG: TonB-dependent receptor [Flavobacteriia bacterium]|nr:MAG: TonB-dependent receptor [Flavobacteriia bacterium]
MGKKILLSAVLSIISLMSFGQTGILKGIVSDGEFNDVLPHANVVIKGTELGIISDFDGSYEFVLDPDTYTLIFSYVGYEDLAVTDIVVTANQTTEINTTLMPSSSQLEEVVITASTAKNTEASLIAIQKKSVRVMNGISSEGLLKTGAGDLAGAVKSVSGVSVQGDKYVFVRGLGDRYTKSILNGVDIPGLDPDKNTVQMDLFPSSIIDNVQVIKSATADLDADFTGGIVNIITKDFSVKKQLSWSVGVGYNPMMHFNDKYLNYGASGTDFLGFDNGMRDLPISRESRDPNYIPRPFEQDDRLTTITQSLNPELKAKQATSSPDLSLGFSFSNQKNIGDNKLGYMVALGYKNYTNFYENYEQNIFRKSDDKSIYELETGNLQTGNLGNKGALINGLTGLSYKTDKSKYSLNFLHIQNGESNASYSFKDERFTNNVKIHSDYLDYTQRSISNAQLKGKHSNDSEDFKVDWIVSSTFSNIQDKDVRYTPFKLTEQGELLIKPSDAGRTRRLWRNLSEKNLVSKADASKKHQFFNRDAQFKFGVKYTFKQRDFSIDQYYIELRNSNGAHLNGDADALLATENLWVPNTVHDHQTTYVTGNYEPANTYDAHNKNIAAYISDEFQLSKKLKSILGIRFEKFTQYYTGQNNSGTEIYNNQKTIEDFGVFPSLNLIYNVNEDSNLRLSYYMATARPSFKEASISQIYDPLSGIIYNGNLNLKPSLIQNFDVRYEWFTNRKHLIAFSGFFKSFKDPIELTFYSASAPGNTQHRNFGKANVFGGELELRQNLGLLTDVLDKFELNVNFSYIKSIQEMDKTPNGEYESKLANLRQGETMSDTRVLQGQSPYLINTVLSYSHDNGWSGNLAYNVQGKTLEIIGIGAFSDVYTMPFNSLNFNLSKTIGKKQQSKVKFQFNNLLNEDKVSVFQSYNAKDQIYTKRRIGSDFSISYTYQF